MMSLETAFQELTAPPSTPSADSSTGPATCWGMAPLPDRTLILADYIQADEAFRRRARKTCKAFDLPRPEFRTCPRLQPTPPFKPTPSSQPQLSTTTKPRQSVAAGIAIRPENHTGRGSNGPWMTFYDGRRTLRGFGSNHHVLSTFPVDQRPSWRQGGIRIETANSHRESIRIGSLQSLLGLNLPDREPGLNTCDFGFLTCTQEPEETHQTAHLGKKMIPEAAQVERGDEVFIDGLWGARRGRVETGADAIVRVNYGEHKLVFKDVILTKNVNLNDSDQRFSMPGFSGSGIYVAKSKKSSAMSVAGIHFAGGGDYSIEMRIQNVLDEASIVLGWDH